MHKRWMFLTLVAGLLLFTGFMAFRVAPASVTPADELPEMTVYKSPTCGCCTKWVDHLEAAGFKVNVLDMPNVAPVKERLGVPGTLASCHTGVVDGYVVEGHVPADVIKQMLNEDAEIAGLAVPGMPIGSPGMEGPNPQPYDVVAFQKDGSHRVYARR